MKFELQIKWNTESAILQVKEAIFEKRQKNLRSTCRRNAQNYKLKHFLPLMIFGMTYELGGDAHDDDGSCTRLGHVEQVVEKSLQKNKQQVF